MNYKKKDSVTVHDIAAKLNIAASTVSRALNNNPRISEKTKNLVWQTAKAMGYQSGLMNSAGFEDKSKLIAVIVPEMSSFLFAETVKVFRKVTHESGYRAIVALTDDSEKMQNEIISDLLGMNISGVAISVASGTKNTKVIREIVDKKIPLVLFNSIDLGLPVPKIVLDHYHEMYSATAHLISMGCNKIAHLAKRKNAIYAEHSKGYRDALEKGGVRFVSDFVIHSDLTPDDIEASLRILFNLPQSPDSIIVDDNFAASQILNILKQSNIRVPEDVAIISFGVERFNEFLSPSVTTVQFPAYEIGMETAKKLLKEIKYIPLGNKPKNSITIKSSKLIIRSTSMKK